ncbi:hypothetical protein Tco_1163945 [Tanacetum coccineum]
MVVSGRVGQKNWFNKSGSTYPAGSRFRAKTLRALKKRSVAEGCRWRHRLRSMIPNGRMFRNIRPWSPVSNRGSGGGERFRVCSAVLTSSFMGQAAFVPPHLASYHRLAAAMAKHGGLSQSISGPSHLNLILALASFLV